MPRSCNELMQSSCNEFIKYGVRSIAKFYALLFICNNLVLYAFKPIILKQVPRVMPLYRKVDWTAFKAFAKDKCEEILKDHPSVEDLWSSFKSVIHNGIAKFVPSKILGTKKSLPWITQPIKKTYKEEEQAFS